MTEDREDGIRVEAVEVEIDYDKLFEDRLRVLEQMIYEFRFRRGLKDGHEDVGAFAQRREGNIVKFTARSSHAGHIIIDSFGRTVMLDFSLPDVPLEITADDKTSLIEADAAGVFILTDVQKKLAEIDLDSVDI